MAKAVKPTKAAKPTKVLTTKKFFTISGSDPRNGIVTLTKAANGLLLTNSRTELSKQFTCEQEAIAAYNHQINTSH
jgi:hypothetical protein